MSKIAGYLVTEVKYGRRIYGPFDTAEEAAEWVGKHGPNFVGALCIQAIMDKDRPSWP